MSINGASRMVQAQEVLNGESNSELNAKFANENETVKSIKKIPLKNPSEHNHSK